MKNLKLYETFSKSEKLDESMGGRLSGTFEDLKDMTKSLNNASKSIHQAEIASLLKDVDALEAKFKKALKGKGIIGW